MTCFFSKQQTKALLRNYPLVLKNLLTSPWILCSHQSTNPVYPTLNLTQLFFSFVTVLRRFWITSRLVNGPTSFVAAILVHKDSILANQKFYCVRRVMCCSIAIYVLCDTWLYKLGFAGTFAPFYHKLLRKVRLFWWHSCEVQKEGT